MHLSIRRLAAVAGGCLFVAGLALRLPPATASLLENIALLRLVAAPACDPAWFVCAHSPWATWYPPQPLRDNSGTVRWALDRLRQAEALDPANRSVRVRQAELLFSLGERGQAAAMLTEAGWPPAPEPDPASSSLRWPAGSPLLTVGRYEYYLVRGRQWAAAGQWQAAAQEYRLGLALAGERGSTQDRADFYAASAQWHYGQADSPAKRWLAGKYFALAGESEQAVDALQPLLAGGKALSDVERAWAFYYLGRAYQDLGDTPAAVAAYQAGWQTSPAVRPNGITLAGLLVSRGDAQAPAVQQALIAAGPAFPSGRSGPGYQLPVAAVTPTGLGFAGYDVDPESVEYSAALEVWLWWKKPDGFGSQDWGEAPVIELGDYVFQRQTLTNVIPNNAFEWGEQPNGVPIGWQERMYTDTPESLYVTTAQRDGRETRVVVSANLKHESTGLRGFEMPVERDGWYLMAGWINDTGNGNLGRNCQGDRFQPGGPYYIAYANQAPLRPAGAWVHYADLAPAFPDQQPDLCQILLTDFQAAGGVTMWDDLILARIELP